MTRDGHPPEDAYTAIPILLEPVVEPFDAVPALPPVPRESEAGQTPTCASPARRPLGREDQQPLFDDMPEAAPAQPRPKRSPPTPPLLRVAERMLRERAPMIVDEILAAHAADLDRRLRARLTEELARLLAELAAGDDQPAA